MTKGDLWPQKKKTALFSNTREIWLERALLYTASHRQTEGEAGDVARQSDGVYP
ncbi:hypothetical protein ACNKHU_24975 [Shigella flexneri]